MSEIDWAALPLHLRAGAGHVKGGVCVMEMVDYIAGNDAASDQPECACPTLTRLAIALNDRAPSQAHRDRLIPLAPMLAGSRDPAQRQARAWFILQQLVLRGLAVKLEGLKRPELAALAAPMRAAGDREELLEAVRAARAAMRDAFATCPVAMKARADAYADVYADADADADADGSMKDFFAKSREARWDIAFGVLRDAILLGNHNTISPEVLIPRAVLLSETLAARA